MDKKTIMVDMDNVITDGVFLDYINEYFKTNHKFTEFTEYGFVQKFVGDDIGFWEYVSEKSFYKDAPLLEDCYDVLKKLNDKYDVYIVTAYLWKDVKDISGSNLMNKYNYLKEKLPFIAPEKYIFTTNKKIMNFDIRIDDRISNLNGATTKLLFTAWHNKDVSDEELKKDNIIKVNNWKEIEKILLNK